MRLCSGPGCGRAVSDDVRFCAECKAEQRGLNASQTQGDAIRVHTHGEYDAVLDGLRKSKRWQSIRERAARRCPICARCDLALTEIVDHIVPAAVAVHQVIMSGAFPLDKYAGYFFMSNLQGLCRVCHWHKTKTDKERTEPWPDVLARERAVKKVWAF